MRLIPANEKEEAVVRTAITDLRTAISNLEKVMARIEAPPDRLGAHGKALNNLFVRESWRRRCRGIDSSSSRNSLSRTLKARRAHPLHPLSGNRRLHLRNCRNHFGEPVEGAGLRLDGPEPGPFIAKLGALGQALHTISPGAVAIGQGSAALILGLRLVRPTGPGMLIAVIAASFGAAALVCALRPSVAILAASPKPGAAVGTPNRHLGCPSSRPILHKLLDAVESLLSAKVADGMTGKIARTATNIRAGATSSFAGKMHSGILLVFMLVARTAC